MRHWEGLERRGYGVPGKCMRIYSVGIVHYQYGAELRLFTPIIEIVELGLGAAARPNKLVQSAGGYAVNKADIVTFVSLSSLCCFSRTQKAGEGVGRPLGAPGVYMALPYLL